MAKWIFLMANQAVEWQALGQMICALSQECGRKEQVIPIETCLNTDEITAVLELPTRGNSYADNTEA